MAISILESLPIVGGFDAAHPTLSTILGIFLAVLVAAFLYLYTYKAYTLPFKNVPGPRSNSLFWGNLRQIIDAQPNVKHSEWEKEHGTTYRYQVLLGGSRLCSTDPAFLGYVLQHSDDFIKPEQTNRLLVNILGDGLLTAEGSTHRRQRRVINPAFGPAAIRDMEPIFWDKTYHLQARLLSFFDDDSKEQTSPTPAKPEDQVKGTVKVDVQKYLSQATLDVIGAAGFDYEFGALSEESNDLAKAFSDMFSAGTQVTGLAILEAFVPFLRNIVPSKRRQLVREARARCEAIGANLVAEKKRAIASLIEAGSVEKGDFGKDLLSLLIRANMAPDLRPDQRLTDEEVLAQITTFILAGNETSSTAVTWLLYRLAQNPDIQARLSAECLAISESRPSLATVEALPYLDKVVHESLRLDDPVPGTIRQASTDAVIPLSQPIVGRDDNLIDHVRIHKGQQIFIPIWGPDAAEFNPDRFDVGGIPSQSVPGVWGNLLTFLGGARNCIGYRFALAEIKVLVFVLVRTFQFSELPSKPTIERKSSPVLRPLIVGEESFGLQMPLLMRPLSTQE